MVTISEALAIAFEHHRAGRLAHAEPIYRKILEVAPDHLDAVHLLGLIARRTGRNEEALTLIRRATEIDPTFPEAHYNLGNALCALGRFDEAVAPFQRALDLKPDHAGARRGLERALSHTDELPQLAELLDAQYRQGRWAYLAGIHEVARYGVVSSYVNTMMPDDRPGAVLDLGCGEGHLFPYLLPHKLASYVGVDISQVALEKSRVSGSHARLVCSPLETFEPDQDFEVILFNEVLVYIDDPIGLMCRYRRWLKPGGVMVVSYYREPEPEPGHAALKEHGLWAAIDRGDWRTLDEVTLHNRPRNLFWRMRLVRPQVQAVT